MPPTVRQGVFYLSPNAGPSKLAGKLCNKNYFNVAWQNDNNHEAMGQYVHDQGFQNVYILAPNYPAGRDALTGFKRYYTGTPVQEAFGSPPAPRNSESTRMFVLVPISVQVPPRIDA